MGRFGTARNAEACAACLLMPGIDDALLQTPVQLKLVLLGHVTQTLLSSSKVRRGRWGTPGAQRTREIMGGAWGWASGSCRSDRARGRALQADNGANHGGFLHFLFPKATQSATGAPDHTVQGSPRGSLTYWKNKLPFLVYDLSYVVRLVVLRRFMPSVPRETLR